MLLTRSFRVEKSGPREAQEPDQLLDYVIMRYPAEGSVGCNEPEAAGYLLTILNATQETLDVTIGGVALEDMLPGEQREVLLEEGTPYRPPAPVVLDSEGKNRFRRGDLKYIGAVYEHPVDEMAKARMRVKTD
ncbi:MAG: hypothetical protein GX557_03700 [Chloroflexi bacterium]|nr:hypothetical protein [Chloroflexota bacterium]